MIRVCEPRMIRELERKKRRRSAAWYLSCPPGLREKDSAGSLCPVAQRRAHRW